MTLDDSWKKALQNTEIIRSRIQELMTFADTHVPYILLSESSVNMGDSVVRKGEVLVTKPSLIIPPNIPQFDGFHFEENLEGQTDSIVNFLMLRGVTLPSLRFNNQTYSLDIFEGKLKDAITHYKEELQRKEDVRTGLLVGPEDCWQLSMLIFICTQVARNANTDIKRLLEDFKKRENNL